MGFKDAARHLERLGVDAMKHLAPSLKRIEAITEALNHPERSIPAIHITGTNGKTSTARIATSLLVGSGLSVGTYTSPHLESVTERIMLSGEPISQHAFGELYDHIRPYLDEVERSLSEELSYFELLTAMFFLWASEQPVDVMVVEVGLGGRWDATNVVPSQVSVITNIGLDHTALLGEDRVSIAKEKSGIIKPNTVVVTAERGPDVLRVIEQEAQANGSEISLFGRDFDIQENLLALGGRYLSASTSAAKYEGLFLPMHGAHQGVNAVTGLEAVTRFLPAHELSQEVIQEGLSTVVAPGRLETVEQGGGSHAPVLLDVAHNPDGMSALITTLIETFAFEKVVFVLGILADKDHAGMLREVARVTGHVIATEAKSVRSVPAAELLAAAKELGLEGDSVPEVASAVRRALQIATPGDLVCVTGSHYVVGEARGVLRGSRSKEASDG